MNSKLNNFLTKFSIDDFGDILDTKDEKKLPVEQIVKKETEDKTQKKPTIKLEVSEKAKDEEFFLKDDDFDAFSGNDSVKKKNFTDREVSDQNFLLDSDEEEEEEKNGRSDSFVFPEEVREKRPSVMIYEEKRKNFKNLFRELEEIEASQPKVIVDNEDE